MANYNSTQFIEAFRHKVKHDVICPYCNGNSFTTTEYFATLITGTDTSGITIGSSVPAGMVICENCGHIDFFALGVLGLLNNEGKKDGKK